MRYYFDQETDCAQVEHPDGHTEWRTWTAEKTEKEVVRRAFSLWKSLGVGREFSEVKRRENAEIKIGFMQRDGSWSYLGRQALKFGANERTMNFGWSLEGRDGLDIALHEIGHALGCPHEHQNSNSGIEWDEEAVYRWLAGSPNYWSREKTHYNVLRKLAADKVEGSGWNRDSVMHYPFPANLVLNPEPLRKYGINPAGGLSSTDKQWTTKFYPPLTASDYTRLELNLGAVLEAGEDQQRHFCIIPEKNDFYEFQTFGKSDSVTVLFKQTPNGLRFVTSSDDKGKDGNAYFKVKLEKGTEYVLRILIFYAENAQHHSVMMS